MILTELITEASSASSSRTDIVISLCGNLGLSGVVKAEFGKLLLLLEFFMVLCKISEDFKPLNLVGVLFLYFGLNDTSKVPYAIL